MYAVVAVIELEPQIRDEFVALALQSVEGAHHEPGCQRFDVVQSVDHPNRIGFYEVYRDRAALDAHRTQPYFQAWWNATSRWQTEDLVRLLQSADNTCAARTPTTREYAAVGPGRAHEPGG